MEKIYIRKNSKSGFSLTELAIVICIVGIIFYSAVKFASSGLQMAKIKSTQTQLAKIQEALQNYLNTNQRLPCPSSTTGFTSTWSSPTMCSSHVYTAVGTVFRGTVPTASLGLPNSYAFDGWGTRITYAVSTYCIIAANWTHNGTSTGAYCNNGVAGTNGGHLIITNTSAQTVGNAAYILISHGKNRLGGWDRAGNMVRTPCPSAGMTLYERTNGGNDSSCNIVPPGFSFYDDVINDGDVAANYFDDIVAWTSDNMLDYYACKAKAPYTNCM